MNRIEALRVLGLDEDATLDDIKVAYKEMAQILHPDRFASSKKLQDRATEQFKNLQEAYDLLLKGGKGKSRGASTQASGGYYSPTNAYEARLAGIAAARTQLVAQKDVILDERRNALIIGGIGAVIAVVLRRLPIGIGLGTTAIVYAVVRFLSAQSTISNLDEHIKRLNKEQKIIQEELEKYYDDDVEEEDSEEEYDDEEFDEEDDHLEEDDEDTE